MASQNRRTWANTGLSWAEGDTVPVLIARANKPPVFTERGGGTERYLYENPPTPFGRFGAVHRMVPVKATDPDGDALRYALEGRDAHLFTIDEAAGWIMTRADTIYDYETEERTCHYKGDPEFRPCYAMRVRVTDSFGASATKGLSILLDNDVDRIVQNLRVVAPADKSDELRVSWNPVSPDERPESYWVEWYTAGEGESWRWYRKSIEGDRSGTHLRSLEADTRYRVRVRPIYPDDHRLRDRGLSGSFAWDPGRGTGRGPKLTLTQTVGASASGGMDALLGRGTLEGLAANDSGAAGAAPRLTTLKASSLQLSGLTATLRRPLSTLHDGRCRTPCKTRFRPAGCAFAGRGSNPLGRIERFQINSSSFPGLRLALGQHCVLNNTTDPRPPARRFASWSN